MVMMNRTFLDPIWPDLSQEQAGLFGEWEQPLQESTQLRAGIRVDQVEQDAGKADAKIVPGPGVGMTTVEQAWVDVGDSEPGVVSNSDTLVSGNIVIEQELTPDWMMQLGLSRVEAVPNLTQRYLSFGPVPGGFGIGTPSLDPEEKLEIELRTEGQVGAHRLGGALFAARINDYLLPTTVAMLDVNGDGRVDRVKGTVNEDAELFGAEASALLTLRPGIVLPIRFSVVRGEVIDSGTPLPEMPPLELRAALRWQEPETQSWFVEFGGFFAAEQDRIDPEFGEDETPSFALFHVRGGKTLSAHWRIEAGIENLFDREYHEHLTREALLPEGDLKPGDEVPGPGRGFHLAVKASW
jgi:iron complex outermembrane receptor protein